MLATSVVKNTLRIGERCSISFHRTLRIPADGQMYPLPPGLGMFPLYQIADFAGRVPQEWREQGGVLMPMYQREALWIGFEGTTWKPNVVQVGIGEINALTGQSWSHELTADPQNYVVCPRQPWLDGINAGDGFIRQFVAMPLGLGYTVEGQLTGKEVFGGIQVRVYEPKPGKFPDHPPSPADTLRPRSAAASPEHAAMGISAGDKIQQKIYPDPYGVDTWDLGSCGTMVVHIMNSAQFWNFTGQPPPPTPIDAKTYTEHGFPWFHLYDEREPDVAMTSQLAGLKSVTDLEKEKRLTAEPYDEKSIEIKQSQIKKLWRRTDKRQ